MSSIGYYPGCSLGGTAAEYDHSLRAIAERLKVELREIPEWICCGASSAHAIDHNAALAMAADTLAKARRAGIDEILAPCAMCYQRLAVAVADMKAMPGLSGRVAEALGEPADLGMDRVRPVNVLTWLGQLPQGSVEACVSRPLKGLKVACYYGCLLLRPPKINVSEDAEAPRSMERLVKAAGAEPVRWSMAMECCGGSFALSRKSVVLRQGHRIVDAARKAGADVICLACPMCHNNLDLRQAEFNAFGEESMPIVYLTQLLGLSFGLSGQQLGFEGHFTPVEPALSEALAKASA